MASCVELKGSLGVFPALAFVQGGRGRAGPGAVDGGRLIQSQGIGRTSGNEVQGSINRGNGRVRAWGIAGNLGTQVSGNMWVKGNERSGYGTANGTRVHGTMHNGDPVHICGSWSFGTEVLGHISGTGNPGHVCGTGTRNGRRVGGVILGGSSFNLDGGDLYVH